MATVKLDKDTTLDLMDGEAVIFATKVTRAASGFLKFDSYECNFAISTKRIALVPYPKKGKEARAVDSINYSDIKKAKEGPSNEGGSYVILYMKAGKKKQFVVHPSKGEMTKAIGKSVLGGVLGVAKEFADGFTTIADSQKRIQAAEASKLKHGYVKDSDMAAANEMIDKENKKFDKDWEELFEISNSVPNSADHKMLSIRIVTLINKALTIAK